MSNYPDKCSGCGGMLSFNPKTISFECKNCGSSIPVVLKVAKEKPYAESEINERAWMEDTKTIKCNACGAVDVMNRGDLADVCPFCGSSNVEDASHHSGLIPDGLMPFSITQEEANILIKNKIKKNIWAPKNFKKNVKLSNAKAIYTPVFSFDSIVVGSYTGRLGKDEEEQITNVDGSLSTHTETKWFNVSGEIKQRFDDVLVSAGQMISSITMSELEPYNTAASIEYDKVFLNGCIANTYKKDLKSSFEQCKETMKVEVKDSIIKKYDADHISSLDIDVDFVKPRFKYLLLPVYSSGCRYDEKNYNLFVNGTTGKVVGKLPVSKGKVWGTVLGVLLGIGSIIALAVLL